MRVVAPWEVTETSLYRDHGKRRRKPQTKQQPDPVEADSDLLVSARFVTTATTPRKRSKTVRNGHDIFVEDVMPSLVLTSEHRVLVFGEFQSENGSNAGIRESKVMEYGTRADKAAAFLSSSTTPQKVSKGFTARHIPVVLDATNSRFYGLQNGNTRLISWNTCHGPEECTSVKLDEPALCMSSIHTTQACFVCGTLASERVFIATSDDENLSLKCFTQAELPVNALYVGSFAILEKTHVYQEESGSKRKAETPSSGDEVFFFQFFSKQNSFIMVRHHFSGLSNGIANASRVNIQSATIPMIGESSALISYPKLLGVDKGSQSAVLLYSTFGDDNGTGKHQFFVSISLQSGDIATVPMQLPDSAQQAALLGASVLAVGSHDDIQLIDIVRGAEIGSISVRSVADAADYLLVGDPICPKLAILFTKEGKLWVASTSLDSETVSTQFALSTSLALALRTNKAPKLSGPSLFEKPLSGVSLDLKSDSFNDAFATGIFWLNECFDQVLKDSMANASLLEAFEKCLCSFHEKTCFKTSEGVGNAENPQDAIVEKTPTQKNGTHKIGLNGNVLQTFNGKNGNNSRRVREPSMIPRPFVDHIVPMLIHIFLHSTNPKQSRLFREGSILLETVIKTGKLSARTFNFTTFVKILDALDSCNERIYTPVEFSFDFLEYCVDVSERQIAVILQFTISKLNAIDFAKKIRSLKGSMLNRNVSSLLERFMEDPLNESIATQLISYGSMLLMKQIIGYSAYNESLLFHALKASLNREEVAVAVMLLLRLQSSMKIPITKQASSMHMRIFKFLACLTDSLRSPLSASEVSLVEKVKKVVDAETSRTETIIHLQPTIIQTAPARQQKSSRLSATVHENINFKQLAPYQIERLLL